MTKPINPNAHVAVVFGGVSCEHEISIITGLEVLAALDSRTYQGLPVYIAQNGRWYTGDALRDKTFYAGLPKNLSQLTEVLLPPIPGQQGLTVVAPEKISWTDIARGTRKPKHIPVDLFMPILHGSVGEDGCIQGLFEMAEVAYTGSGLEASANGMNKFLCKSLMREAGIPVLPAIRVLREAWHRDPDNAIAYLSANADAIDFPLFVKPCNLGSSIGISTAKDQAGLHRSLAKVFQFDSEAIVEPQVQPLFELNVSVLSGEPLRTSAIERPDAGGGLLTYEQKYCQGAKSKKGGQSSLADMPRNLEPSDVSDQLKQTVRDYAKLAFQTLGCRGVARIDFLINADTEQLYFNEINTLPGSMSYYLWEYAEPALTYTRLLSHVIEDALAHHQLMSGTQRDTGFKALFKQT